MRKTTIRCQSKASKDIGSLEHKGPNPTTHLGALDERTREVGERLNLRLPLGCSLVVVGDGWPVVSGRSGRIGGMDGLQGLEGL